MEILENNNINNKLFLKDKDKDFIKKWSHKFKPIIKNSTNIHGTLCAIYNGYSYSMLQTILNFKNLNLNIDELIDSKSARSLSNLECERLQGFPDNWTEGVSDLQRYKQCGNSVTVNVIKYIIENMIR